MHVHAFLPVEHAGGKLQHLPDGVVEIAALTREFPHLGERGNAHVHVVQPERLRLRTGARQRAIGQAELFLGDMVDL